MQLAAADTGMPPHATASTRTEADHTATQRQMTMPDLQARGDQIPAQHTMIRQPASERVSTDASQPVASTATAVEEPLAPAEEPWGRFNLPPALAAGSTGTEAQAEAQAHA